MIEQRRNRRSAFTLVELLVVIAIIAVLAALAVWGAFAMIGAQQRRNSETIVKVANKMLQTRWAAVIADAKAESLNPGTHPYLFSVAGNPDRARIIWIKVRLVEAFPMSYAEVPPPTRPVGYTGPYTVVEYYIPTNLRKPHQNKYQGIVHPGGSLTSGAPGESAACLLMALRTLQADGVTIDDQIKHAIAPTDGTNQINALNDGWGKPLGFYRFAWNDSGIQLTNPGGQNEKFADPVDKFGKLIEPGWYNAPPIVPPNLNYRQQFELQFHQVGPTPVAPGAGPAKAHYVIPVIASAGRDGQMQLNADLSSAGTGSADNILSYQLRD